MKTVGYNVPKHERFRSTATCDLCGVRWYRSRMTRKPNGLLVCPEDAVETDALTLSEANASAAAGVAGRRRVAPADGNLDTIDGSSLSSVHYNNATEAGL